MSFLSIPDIDPVIDLHLCDAVNLLLASIAMEEISLSRLMDAEHDKIQYVLTRCQSGGCDLPSVAAVNDSANHMLKTIIQLQMLLQFKLENVRELTPCCSTTTTTTTTSTTTTTTTATCSCCGCCLLGTGRGCAKTGSPPFRRQQISLHALVSSRDPQSSVLRYTAAAAQETLSLHTSGYGVQMACPLSAGEELLLCGTGWLSRSPHACSPLTEEVFYTLTVRSTSAGQLAFRMQITSRKAPRFTHDSGFVPVNPGASDLRVECA